MDTIVYTLVTNGGGIDGMDRSDKGGKVSQAFLTHEEALKHPNGPWCHVKKEVVDLEVVAKDALRNLDPVTRLAVTTHYKIKLP